MSVRPLTEKQQAILKFIMSYIAANNYPPSIREIGDDFGIQSTNGVFDHLNALARKGYIEREIHQARSITVLLNPDGSSAIDPRQGYREILVELRKFRKWANSGKSKVNGKSVLERVDSILKPHEQAA